MFSSDYIVPGLPVCCIATSPFDHHLKVMYRTMCWYPRDEGWEAFELRLVGWKNSSESPIRYDVIVSSIGSQVEVALGGRQVNVDLEACCKMEGGYHRWPSHATRAVLVVGNRCYMQPDE